VNYYSKGAIMENPLKMCMPAPNRMLLFCWG
jgi:hypothetical protein